MTGDELTMLAEQTASEIAAMVEHSPFADVESNVVVACILAALHRAQRAQMPWTTAWPTAKGWYWFYGVMSRGTQAPELLPVCVRHGAHQQPFYVVCGTFMYQAEGAHGQWQSMSLPTLPDVEEATHDQG